MKKLLTLFLLSTCASVSAQIPKHLQGSYQDDYGSKYVLTDSTFAQTPHSKYKVLEWNEKEQYILAQNDASNKYMPNMFTKISITTLSNMEPYTWAFCYTAFKAATIEEARAVKSDASDSRKGCNGYPFSRMKVNP